MVQARACSRRSAATGSADSGARVWIAHGMVYETASSLSSIGMPASSRSSTSAGSIAALWRALRTLFQTPARRCVSPVVGSRPLRVATVTGSGSTSAQVSS